MQSVSDEGSLCIVKATGKMNPFVLGDGDITVSHTLQFDKSLEWALAGHDIRTEGGALIKKRRSSDFIRIGDRQLFLPREIKEWYYVGKGGGLVDVVTAERTISVDAVSVGPFKDSEFVIDYRDPGVFVQDETGDRTVQYIIPPNPKVR